MKAWAEIIVSIIEKIFTNRIKVFTVNKIIYVPTESFSKMCIYFKVKAMNLSHENILCFFLIITVIHT